ncbi:uncharacterized protein [Amphiura filiformis]|uniref:uncharacterized protein n=1 Tax=Amphiura filiformis TaxID=82378 RepID=UPI003B224C15
MLPSAYQRLLVMLVLLVMIFLVAEVQIVYSITCNALPFPKSYIAYHLDPDERIDIDGKLNEKQWMQVGATDRFVDIQGSDFPKPRFLTWVKMRWDDTYLYIGAYLEETDVFANQTQHDSVVFKDNDFEVFTDPDWSTHWYKEFEINAINTTWDLILNKPYMNGGFANSSFEMPALKTATYVDGPVNDPNVPNKFWSVEIAMPLKSLVTNDSRAKAPPKNKDQWRINFSRVEWHVKNVNGHYEKVPGLPEDNWVWSPQHAINMHIPERWGILQFSTEKLNSSKFIKDPNWPVYQSLIEVYNAEKKFFSIQGYFTSDITQLELPSYVAKGQCAQIPIISVKQSYHFNVTVQPFDLSLSTGHIQGDRLIWWS